MMLLACFVGGLRWKGIEADMITGPTWSWSVAPFPPQLVHRALARSVLLEAFGPQRITATAQASGA
jgi:hypothetical protein